ncbi:MAG: porin [Planctomycetaceae bacterium]
MPVGTRLLNTLGTHAWVCIALALATSTAFSQAPEAPPAEPGSGVLFELTEPFAQEPPAATDPIAELRAMLQQQRAELERQRELIEELQNRGDNPVSYDPNASAAGPATKNVSTVPGSVFGPDAASGAFGSDGLTFTSKDGNFKTHLGGVVQLDFVNFGNLSGITSIPGGAGVQDSVTFRRLRLRAEGTMYRNIDWVFESDYALALQNVDPHDPATQATGLRNIGGLAQGGNTIHVMQPTTVFMTFKELPVVGNIRVGNQQDWISLEHIESARFLDFMERAPIMDVFTGANNNGYTPGISVFNNTANKRAGLQVGVYKNNVYDSGFSYDIGDAWTYGGRLICTPYYDEASKGRYLIHTGVGAEYRSFNTAVGALQGFDNVRVRSRGDIRNASSVLDPNFADTGNFFALGQTLLNPEVAIQWGPWLFQAEYMASWFNGAKPAKNVATNLGTVFMNGGYAEVLYFLTGENRTYIQQSGVFGRTIPKQNADIRKGQWGAWQVGVRYDWVDLNYGAFVNGGQEQDATFGVNWFLNANARFQFNYVISWVDNAPPVTFPGTAGALNGSRFVGDGTIQTFGARMDFNF